MSPNQMIIIKIFGHSGKMYRNGEKDGIETLRSLMNRLEEELRTVMDCIGMLVQLLPDNMQFNPEDAADYFAMQSVVAALEEQDVLEFWKTATYLLNFMTSMQSRNLVTAKR